MRAVRSICGITSARDSVLRSTLIKPGPAEKGYDEYLETVLETDPKVKALLETEQEKQ